MLLDGSGHHARADRIKRCIAGIGRSYQIPHPFENLTVFENLLVGAVYGRGMSERQVIDICGDILERTHLSAARQCAGRLADVAGTQASRNGARACDRTASAAA